VRELIAVLLAATTSSLYALSTSLQALEARRDHGGASLHSSLLRKLVRRPLWLAGTAAGLVAWPLQAVALALASVALVQPALGLGLIVLLVLGVHILGEHVGAREIVAAASITGAIVVLGWAAPSHTGSFTHVGRVTVAVGLVLAGAAPYALRAVGRSGGLATSIAAGCAWAVLGLATALIVEELADRNFLEALAWGAGAALAAWSGLLAEMSALQAWPATRAIPVVFALEMALPAALAPFLTRTEPAHAVAFGVALAVACGGAILLGASKAVAHAAAPLTAP
jgi:drug/metabolite transporter (DMT)-like permease